MDISSLLAVIIYFASPVLPSGEKDGQSLQDTRKKSFRLPLHEAYGSYYGEIEVGTPAQKFKVTFETRGSTTWLVSEDCQTCKAAAGARPLSVCGEKKSTTLKRVSGTVTINFQERALNGKKAKDIFKIGGVGGMEVVLQEVVFAEIENLVQEENNLPNEGFFLEEADGIVALGLRKDNDYPGNNLVDMMVKEKSMQPVFGIYLKGPRQDDETTEDGYIVFGGDDEDLVEGEFSFHEVVKVDGKSERWQIQLDKISVKAPNGTIVHVANTGATLAIPTPGSTIISGPKADFDQLNSVIHQHCGLEYEAEQLYDCELFSTNQNIPDVTFTLGGKEFILSPQHYIIEIEAGRCQTVLLGSSSLSEVVLGTVFMEEYYTKFDVGKQRVEFAKLKHISTDIVN